MSDEQNQEVKQEAVEQTAPEAPSKFDLQGEINTRLNSDKSIKDTVIDELVAAERAKRITMIRTGLEKKQAANIEFRKACKPDVEQFDESGKQLKMFTKSAYEAKKKAEEQLTKINNALDQAVNKNDFKKLEEIVK